MTVRQTQGGGSKANVPCTGWRRLKGRLTKTGGCWGCCCCWSSWCCCSVLFPPPHLRRSPSRAAPSFLGPYEPAERKTLCCCLAADAESWTAAMTEGSHTHCCAAPGPWKSWASLRSGYTYPFVCKYVPAWLLHDTKHEKWIRTQKEGCWCFWHLGLNKWPARLKAIPLPINEVLH